MRQNGILIIDKPENWTSHDVVAKLRGLLGERRIGHGGTLDPMATGVLPVFVGRATRAVSFLPSEKTYQAVLRLGRTTDSQDRTGTTLTTSDMRPEAEQVLTCIHGFLGEREQIPPMVSAVKVGGRKLYELARKGVEVERKPRLVNFYRIDARQRDADTYELTVACSGGTYIRTLCHDIGQRLGCGAVLEQLRRIKSGPYRLEDAVTLETIQNSENRAERVMAVDSLFLEYPEFRTEEHQTRRALQGNPFEVEQTLPEGRYRVYDADGRFLLLGQLRDGTMTSVKSFFEVTP